MTDARLADLLQAAVPVALAALVGAGALLHTDGAAGEAAAVLLSGRRARRGRREAEGAPVEAAPTAAAADPNCLRLELADASPADAEPATAPRP